ncbi:MAG: hypothetical protein HFI48_11775 [Lachnospiraceae bacterium]|nr:hypothetical protein [Lachnospiraceae bacterium]
MFSIIWSIVVCYIVIRIIRQRNTQNGSGGTNQGMPQGRLPGQGGALPGNGAHSRRVQQSRPMPQPQQIQQSVQSQPDEPEAGSTLEYLEEKARQDAIEHAREKREEAQRLHKNYGGLRVAERFYEGSAVPNGKRCVVCGYCGAENLVPMMPRERYSCYFCREAVN